VNASAWEARSIAFLNLEVAINSIVRVILRMLRIALRRLTSSRVLAMSIFHHETHEEHEKKKTKCYRFFVSCFSCVSWLMNSITSP